MKPLVEGSRQPLVERYDAALLDLDGALYLGTDAAAGVPEAVAAARDAGMRVAFVTNNASRTPDAVATHLSALGIVAEARDVVTSAQAAATLVASAVPPGSAVLVVGGEGLHAALLERGLCPVRSVAEDPVAVVQGFSPDVGWRLLAEGAYAVSAGLPWVASNLDVTVPTTRGLAPGNGALVSVIVQATGRFPVTAGKPETPLHLEAMRRTAARSAVVVGDRLDTDIEGANRAGGSSLLVLTGVTSPLDLVLAEPQSRPTYVSEDLSTGLLQPHPPVRRWPGDRWRCGGWECAVTGGRIEMTGAGEWLDGLRAVSVACWHVEDRGDSEEVREAVQRLGL